MKVEKRVIIALLRERNLDVRADWVDRTLPTIVDTTLHAGLLATLNIDPAQLTGAES